MNYGKKSTAKKRTALISRSSMMGKRARVSFIRVLFVSLIALCIAVTCLGVGSFRGVIDTAPDVDDIDIMPLGYATFLYDDAGNQIRKLAAPDSNRLPVTLDQIPVDLQHAVVAIEDERFYEHNGIDVKGILRAGVKAITTGDFSEGASTITQQLLKNNVFTNWTSESTQLERFTRKIHIRGDRGNNTQMICFKETIKLSNLIIVASPFGSIEFFQWDWIPDVNIFLCTYNDFTVTVDDPQYSILKIGNCT